LTRKADRAGYPRGTGVGQLPFGSALVKFRINIPAIAAPQMNYCLPGAWMEEFFECAAGAASNNPNN
jgi:hypothetical protein